MTSSHEIVFQPDGRRGRFREGTTILDAARELGVDINSICGGAASCGKCVVKVTEAAGSMGDPSSEEEKLIGVDGLREGFRLACRCLIRGEAVILVPRESRTGTQRLQTEGKDTPVEFDPLTRKSHSGDTVQVLHGDEVIDTLASAEAPVLGFAVDLGSTKLAGYLMDLSNGTVLGVETSMNPQIPFGEDIISRLTYALQGDSYREALHSSLVDGVKRLLTGACKKSDVGPGDVYEVVFVGNTVMQHLLLDLDVEPISRNPFMPINLSHRDIGSSFMGLGNPRGRIHFLPLIAGFVGADCVAATLATQLHRSEELCFLIDIGTNTEIVVGGREGMVACSCASGPAFEGAHIKHGMRAASGAIEGVWIDPETLDANIKTIDDAEPLGICGSGLIDALSEMLKAGVIDTSGRILDDTRDPRVRKRGGVSEYVVVRGEESGTGEDIVVSQLDVRELQKGKAAIYSGARIAMDRLGVTRSEIERVYMAGAFGTYINRESAINIGMIPEFPPMRIEQVGNAAGTGARMALISRAAREEAKEIAREVGYVELAAQPGYNKVFLDAMLFPHRELGRFPETVGKLGEKLVLSRLHG